MAAEPTYRSDTRPDFAPVRGVVRDDHRVRLRRRPGDRARGRRRSTGAEALDLLDDMLAIRELEEMIVRLRSGGYDPLPGYDYRGPTHVSIGQEATAVGASLRAAARRQRHELPPRPRRRDRQGLRGDPADDRRASSAPASPARRRATRDGAPGGRPRGARLPDDRRAVRQGGGLLPRAAAAACTSATSRPATSAPTRSSAAACRSRPARRWPIRYERTDRVVCCFAGDGAYANGVVLESLNWAAQDQWTNHLAGDRAYGLPIIYFIQNNHYGMTHRTDDEVMGVRHLARRAAGFAEDNMHAEVVNGMDVLAVRDAVRRAAALCRAGEGPVLIEASTYRYYGHSLSDPRNEYRTREEEAAWRAVDPIERLKRQLVEAGVADEAAVAAVEAGVARAQRPGRGPRGRRRPIPTRPTVLATSTRTRPPTSSPAGPGRRRPTPSRPSPKRDADGAISYRTPSARRSSRRCPATRRVIHYGEDVADYGGAFKLTKGLLEAFGRERVFNTPISRGLHLRHGGRRGDRRPAAGGRADVHGLRPDGLRPDRQPGREVALHERRPGRGAARHPGLGRRRQGLRRPALASRSRASSPTSPGLYVVYPATPADAKGLLKSAIRTNNPVLFVESQGLYPTKGVVPEGELPRPDRAGPRRPRGHGRDARRLGPGRARLADRRRDARGRARHLGRGHRPAQPRPARHGDGPRVGPQDRAAASSPARRSSSGSFVNEIVARIQLEAFDYLDGPVGRIGAANGISPQAEGLERAFLPGRRRRRPRRPGRSAATADGGRRWPTRSSCRSPAR